MIKLLGKLWTDAVAYVALAIGAGLSITFNVRDTLDNRGPLVDRWDIVTAVAFPAIVVLMVEMFVSRRWAGQGAPMQIIRWAGTMVIGGIAMLVSWTHGHDFLTTRGQVEPVPTLGPLAIDLLAIMATALILSGRGHSDVLDAAPGLSSAEDRRADGTPEDTQDIWTDLEDTPRPGQVEWTAPEDTPPLVTVPDALPSWLDGLADRVGPVSRPPLDTPVPRRVPVVPGGNGRLSEAQRTEVAELARAGREARAYTVTEIRELLAAWYGVSTKTIQRTEGQVS